MWRSRCTTKSSNSTRCQLLTAPCKSSNARRSSAQSQSQCPYLTNPSAQRHLLTSTMPDWWEPTDQTHCTYVSQAPEAPLLRQAFSAACLRPPQVQQPLSLDRSCLRGILYNRWLDLSLTESTRLYTTIFSKPSSRDIRRDSHLFLDRSTAVYWMCNLHHVCQLSNKFCTPVSLPFTNRCTPTPS